MCRRGPIMRCPFQPAIRRSLPIRGRGLHAPTTPKLHFFPTTPSRPLLCSPSAAMDKLANLTKFKAACPYLGRTKSSTIRTLCTAASPRYPSLSKLTEKATQCPVMGQALTIRSNQMVAGYASLAGSAEFNKIPEHHGIKPSAADASKCPHASKAIAAARMAEELASAKKGKAPRTSVAAAAKAAHAAAPAGCPFHAKSDTANAASTSEAKPKAATAGGFNYEKFYAEELEKKHQDASYRYFNNINRMASKFPVAHTGDPKDEVEVWCANDYLGMGNNPVVLETMQCVPLSSASERLFSLIDNVFYGSAVAL